MLRRGNYSRHVVQFALHHTERISHLHDIMDTSKKVETVHARPAMLARRAISPPFTLFLPLHGSLLGLIAAMALLFLFSSQQLFKGARSFSRAIPVLGCESQRQQAESRIDKSSKYQRGTSLHQPQPHESELVPSELG